jgi:hypothetical protein
MFRARREQESVMERTRQRENRNMCHKPSRAEGQAKLQRWAQERGERRPATADTAKNTRPRGNPDPDRHDLERGIERLEAMLGR